MKGWEGINEEILSFVIFFSFFSFAVSFFDFFSFAVSFVSFFSFFL